MTIKRAPIFESIFGEQWQQLPTVMHKHYANRPYCNDVVTFEGVMKVEISSFARILSPLLRMSGTLVPYAGENIPVTVHFRSEPDSNVYAFDRIFRFPGRLPFHFQSRMQPIGGNEIIDFMKIGVGWHTSYAWNGQRITMTHRCYAVRLFGRLIRLPLDLMLGRADAWEEPLSDSCFRMQMDIRHPLWGKVYGYGGEFTVTEIELAR